MSDGNFQTTLNQHKAAPAFIYVQDETLGSGAWRPATPSDFSTTVNNTGGGDGGTISGAATSENQQSQISLLQDIKDIQSGIKSQLIDGPSGEKVYLTLPRKDGTRADVFATEKGGIAVGNGLIKFRDGFITAPDPSIWDISYVNQGTTFITNGGNTLGASYLTLSLCPLTEESEVSITSKLAFDLPFRFGFGLTASQRSINQQFGAMIVGFDGNETPLTSPKAPVSIFSTVTIASNVATINFAAPHGFVGGDRVVIYGNTEKRLNVGPVAVTVVTNTQITVPCTLTNGTYTAGGFVLLAPPSLNYSNVAGYIWGDSATATTGSFVSRRNNGSPKYSSGTITTTTATQANTSSFTEAFISGGDFEVIPTMEDISFVTRTADATTAALSFRFTQSIPDELYSYKLKFFAKNQKNISKPIARIAAISKSGSTTATVTTDVAHNLVAGDFVFIYGVRDATNFANLTTQTVVASIVSPTQFTLVMGSAVTASSAGGFVAICNGSSALPGAISGNVQSISRTGNVLAIVGAATWSGLLPGEWIHLYGCNAFLMGLYDGPYKVLRLSTTTLFVESIGVDFGTNNCGGGVIKRTDIRVTYARLLEYTRHLVEIASARGADDKSKQISVAANIIGTPAVTLTTTATTQSGAWNVSAALNTTVADVASAALTTTTTVAAITPALGAAYSVNIPVTAVTGTSPTLDFSIEESDDAGTNWFKVYDFPRITATGMYRSPWIPLRGNRIRYVQTVGGTTPSFTRAVNRLQSPVDATPKIQLVDRSIVLGTLNSTTAAINCEGCTAFNVFVRCSAQTNAAIIGIQVSYDGTNWTPLPETISTVAGIARAALTNVRARFIRGIVNTISADATLGEVVIIGGV